MPSSKSTLSSTALHSNDDSSLGLPSHSPGAHVTPIVDAPPAAAAASSGVKGGSGQVRPGAGGGGGFRTDGPTQSSTTKAAVIGGPAAATAASVIAGIGDLQRVGPAALQAAKARMQVLFDAKAIPKGAPTYEYDKRVEFTAAEEPSDWD
jgi:hypothetical protein